MSIFGGLIAVLAGLIAAIVAGTVVASAIIALIELLELSNYHGPGYLPSCYFLASIIFSVAFIVFIAVKHGTRILVRPVCTGGHTARDHQGAQYRDREGARLSGISACETDLAA
jgi:hypothetical protein